MSVYLRAAEAAHMDDSGGSCWCIAGAMDHQGRLSECAEVRAYSDLFRPYEQSGGWWGWQWGDDAPEDHQTIRDCRVLALLFMHWMEVNP